MSGLTPTEEFTFLKSLSDSGLSYEVFCPTGRTLRQTPIKIAFKDLSDADKGATCVLKALDEVFPGQARKHIREHDGAYLIT